MHRFVAAIRHRLAQHVSLAAADGIDLDIDLNVDYGVGLGRCYPVFVPPVLTQQLVATTLARNVLSAVRLAVHVEPTVLAWIGSFFAVLVIVCRPDVQAVLRHMPSFSARSIKALAE